MRSVCTFLLLLAPAMAAEAQQPQSAPASYASHYSAYGPAPHCGSPCQCEPSCEAPPAAPRAPQQPPRAPEAPPRAPQRPTAVAVPVQPGYFLAPPQNGAVMGASRSVGVDGFALHFPALTIKLPTLQLPSFFKMRNSPRMLIEPSQAPYVEQPVTFGAPMSYAPVPAAPQMMWQPQQAAPQQPLQAPQQPQQAPRQPQQAPQEAPRYAPPSCGPARPPSCDAPARAPRCDAAALDARRRLEQREERIAALEQQLSRLQQSMDRIDRLTQGRLDQHLSGAKPEQRAEPAPFQPEQAYAMHVEAGVPPDSVVERESPPQDGVVSRQDHIVLSPQDVQRLPPSAADTHLVQTVQFKSETSPASKPRLSERAKRLLRPLMRRNEAN